MFLLQFKKSKLFCVTSKILLKGYEVIFTDEFINVINPQKVIELYNHKCALEIKLTNLLYLTA